MTSPTAMQSLVRGTSWPTLAKAAVALGVSPVVAVVAPLLLVVMATSKARSQYFASLFIPVVMRQMDKALAKVKLELFRDVVPGARVLDVGCGSGQYLKYFLTAKAVTELEPNPFMREQIEAAAADARKQNPALDVRVVTGYVSTLVQEKAQFDVAVLGNVCCEIPNVPAVLREIDQVLVPGGKVVFIEHVRRDDWVGWLQDLVNPVWVRISDGCNCNRETLKWIQAVPGWSVKHWDLRLTGPITHDRIIVGVAEKVSASSSSTTTTPTTTPSTSKM